MIADILIYLYLRMEAATGEDSPASAAEATLLEGGESSLRKTEESAALCVGAALTHRPAKKSRSAQTFARNLLHPLPGLEEIAARTEAAVEALRTKNRERAAKWGVPYTEPTSSQIFEAGTVSKEDYLRLSRHDGNGLVSGVNPVAEREAAEARAKRFDIPAFSYEAERARVAGLSDESITLRKERRERAARFGQPDPLDVDIAKAAREALGDDPLPSMPAEGGEVLVPVVRECALHMRALTYLPAASADITAFFSTASVRPSYIEWLNANSLNVLFEDEASAARALELCSEPVPVCPGVDTVAGVWRVALKPLLKLATDKYAPAGSVTTIYLRRSTSADTKGLAPASRGPKTHGTYSKRPEALFSRRRGEGGEGTRVASEVRGSLNEWGRHVADRMDVELPSSRGHWIPTAVQELPVSAPPRVLEVKRASGGSLMVTLPASRASLQPISVQLAREGGRRGAVARPASATVKHARGRGRDQASALGVVPAGLAPRPSLLGKRRQWEEEAGDEGGEGSWAGAPDASAQRDENARDEAAFLAGLDGHEQAARVGDEDL
jgi:hypothetical protein